MADQSDEDPGDGPTTTTPQPAPGAKPIVHLTLDDGPGPETDGFLESQQVIADATGVIPTCFRPPYGARSAATDALIESFGLTGWLWDIDTNDWKFNANNADYTEAQAIAELNKVATISPSYGSEGAIVLLHDGTASAPRMLRLLEEWLEETADDYEFTAIGGC